MSPTQRPIVVITIVALPEPYRRIDRSRLLQHAVHAGKGHMGESAESPPPREHHQNEFATAMTLVLLVACVCMQCTKQSKRAERRVQVGRIT